MGALGSDFHHLFRQTLRHQFIGVVLTEQTPISPFDLLIAGLRENIKFCISIRQRPLRPGPVSLLETPAGANHVLEPFRLGGGKTQLLIDVKQDAPFGGVHRPVGICRHQQEFHAQLQRGMPLPAFAPELRQYVVQRKICLLALHKQAHRRLS